MNEQKNALFWGVALIIIGVLFLFQNLDFIDFGDFVSRFWPLILIGIGIKIIFFRDKEEPLPTASEGEEASSNHFSGGAESRSIFAGDLSENFAGKTVQRFNASNVMGEIKLDFQQARFEPDAYIHASNVLGDVKIILPPKINWVVRATCTAGTLKVLDHREDGLIRKIYTQSATDNPEWPTVTINASIVLGDVEISQPLAQ